jgi:cytidyltransferase-like protein
MKKVFVSGCYDILHAGHLQFFEEARALGDYLIVSFASAEVLWHHKRRKPSIPDDHKRALLQGLRMIDEVVITHGHKEGLDFEDDFLRIKPDFLIVTEDDKYGPLKRELCAASAPNTWSCPKPRPASNRSPPRPSSAGSRPHRSPAPRRLRRRLARCPALLPPRRIHRQLRHLPLVSLREWPYEKQAGLGGSGAWALLNGRDGVESEIDLGVGWQDPAVIRETGLCVWRSGPNNRCSISNTTATSSQAAWPSLDRHPHDTPGVANLPRDYDRIAQSARIARQGVLHADIAKLAEGVASITPPNSTKAWTRSRKSPAPSPANTAAAATAATPSTSSPTPPIATPPSPPPPTSAPSNPSAGEPA